MNYLAHMVIGEWVGLNDAGALGNFIGDAVKGRDVEGTWGEEVGRGIRLHRSIDDVSDRCEASVEARGILRGHCGKWSGVVWDVLVDHVLAQEFETLADGCGPLEAFAASQEAGSSGCVARCQSGAGAFLMPWWPMAGWRGIEMERR